MGRYEINSRPLVPPTRWCSWFVSLFQSPSESSSLGQLPPPNSFYSIQLVSCCHSAAEQSTVHTHSVVWFHLKFQLDFCLCYLRVE